MALDEVEHQVHEGIDCRKLDIALGLRLKEPGQSLARQLHREAIFSELPHRGLRIRLLREERVVIDDAGDAELVPELEALRLLLGIHRPH